MINSDINKPSRRIAHIALLVIDYDQAIDFYVNKLGFILVEDTPLSETKRWVLISPGSAGQCNLLLAKASTPAQQQQVGYQSGGRVFLFLYTDDFERDYQMLIDNNINIVRRPTNEIYGRVAVFEDLYGNLWDLIQPSTG